MTQQHSAPAGPDPSVSSKYLAAPAPRNALDFSNRDLKPALRYVAWVDMMGANSAMRLSLPRAANFIAKIHLAGLEARRGHPGIRLQPVIDGFYIVALDQRAALDFLRCTMRLLADEFMAARSEEHRFFVRCGVAFGPVLLGDEVAKGSGVLSAETAYSAGVALGPAISQAFEAEKLAPIFGIYVHESARSFAGESEMPLHYTLLQWWKDGDIAHAKAFGKAIKKHLGWLRDNCEGTLFNGALDKLDKYGRLVSEYFKID